MEIFILECYNPYTKRYEKFWEGPEEYAEKMFNKPYYRTQTRRLLKITTIIMMKEKANA